MVAPTKSMTLGQGLAASLFTGIGGESFYDESDALKNAKEGNRIDGAFERKHGRRNTGDKPL